MSRYHFVIESSSKELVTRAKLLADDREYLRSRLSHINGKSHESWVDYFLEALDDLGARIEVTVDGPDDKV